MTEDPPKKTPLSLGIEIDADGRVVFTDLPEDLIELVYELDPDAQIGCAMPQPGDNPPAEGESKDESSEE